MQIKSLRTKSYCSWAIADTASEQAIARMRKLESYAELKSAGCTTALCLKTIGWSKATYYRWLKRYQQRGWPGLGTQSRRPKRGRSPQWTKQQEQQVLHLRQRYPLWGKRKLWKVLSRDQGFAPPEHQHSRTYPGAAGALEAGQAGGVLLRAGQAQTATPVPAPRPALAIRDAIQAARRAYAA